jgi:hypothetical protein
MSPWLREAVVTVATSVFVAGPLAAIALVAMPPSWRSPLVLWGILITVLLVVAGRGRGRRRPPGDNALPREAGSESPRTGPHCLTGVPPP